MSLSVYRAYERDSVPLSPDSPFFFDHVSRYWWAASQAQGKDALDCACGKGYGTYILSKTARSAVGIDLNSESLRIARENFGRGNLEYLAQDVLRLEELDRKFELITAFEVIEHIPPETTDAFVASLGRALKEGGTLLVSTPNHDVVLKSGVEVPEFHINNFRPKELRRVLERHFCRVEMIGQFRRRRGFSGVVFDFDYLNLRHVFGQLARTALKGMGWSRQARQSTVRNEVLDEGAAAIPRSGIFDSEPSESKDYRFSSRHWRQAGLTLARCSFPK